MHVIRTFFVSFNKIFLVSALLSPSLFASEIDDVVHGPSNADLKFGVVVKNSEYTIYRSGMLNKHKMEFLSNYLEKHNLPFPKTIIYMNSAGYIFPLHFAIDEYKMSLSGEFGNFEFFHPFGELRTYVDGQNPYYAHKNIDTPLILGHTARRYFEYHNDGVAGGVKTVVDVLKLVLDPERQPVLFHCLGGMHRTGMIGMLLRFIQGGYWVDGPKTEKHGMELNPAEYEYTLYNPVLFRKPNVEFVEEFRHDQRFLELQEKYQEALSNDENLYFGDEDSSSSEEQDISLDQVPVED